MNIRYSSLAAVLSTVVLCTACTTTGDPRSGGIFWSPSKAQARQAELLSLQAMSQQEAEAHENQTGTLRRQINSLQAQIQSKKAQLNRVESIEEAARLRAEIERLENDLSDLYSL